MTSKHNQQPSSEQRPADSFESLNQDELKEYVGNQIDRLGTVSESLYGHDVWETNEYRFAGGREFAHLAESIAHDNEPISSDEKLALLYMDSMIVKNEALAMVDVSKITKRHRLPGQETAALGLQLEEEAVLADENVDHLEGLLRKGKNKDGSALTAANTKGIKEKIIQHKGAINDAFVAYDELTPPDPKIAARYMSEVLERKNGTSTMSDDDFNDTRLGLYAGMRRNLRSARAYAQIVNKDKPVLERKSPYTTKETITDIKAIAEKNLEAKRYAYALDMSSAPEIFDDELDDEYVTKRLAKVPEDIRDKGNKSPKTAKDPVVKTGQEPATEIKPPRTTQGTNNADPSATDTKKIDAGENKKAKDTLLEREKLQEIRVQNAAAALQDSSLRRSKMLFSAEVADEKAEALHAAFAKEVYNLLLMQRPAVLDDPATTPEQKNAFISQYAFDKYHEVTARTVESMGGEKDPKKRKRNEKILRFGGATLGFFLGGGLPGAVVGGAIGNGIANGLNSEMKDREKLKQAVKQYEAQNAADNYLNTPDRAGESYSEKDAFMAATAALAKSFENGLVKRRRLNIGKAGLEAAAWSLGGILVSHEIGNTLQWMGDHAYQRISKSSWSGTGVSWDGGLNPNAHYTMHEKPLSVSVIKGLWSAATTPVGAVTFGGALLSGFGAYKYVQNKIDPKNKGQKRESLFNKVSSRR